MFAVLRSLKAQCTESRYFGYINHRIWEHYQCPLCRSLLIICTVQNIFFVSLLQTDLVQTCLTYELPKNIWFFFSGPETVALRPWVHPAICQNLNPGCLIHDHVSFTLCLSTDTLNTEFWEADSELHSLGLFICVRIPNGDYVLICSELVSLFRYFWDLEFAILDSLGRETWSWPSACFLWPLAFAVLCWSFLRPVSISAAGRTLWLFSSFALCFCKNSDLIVIYTGHW